MCCDSHCLISSAGLLQFKVKMVTADDEQTTDIITSGDVEETTRFCKVCGAFTMNDGKFDLLLIGVSLMLHRGRWRLQRITTVLLKAGTRPEGEGQGVREGDPGAIVCGTCSGSS